MSITVPYRDVDGSGGYRYRQFANGLIQILADPSGKAEGVKLRSDFTGEGPHYAIENEIGRFKDSAYARSNKRLMEDTYAQNGYKLLRFTRPSWVKGFRIGSQGQVDISTAPTVGRVHDRYYHNQVKHLASAIQLPEGMQLGVKEIPSGYRWIWTWKPGDQWTERPDPALVSSAEISDDDLSQINFLGALAPRMGADPASSSQVEPQKPSRWLPLLLGVAVVGSGVYYWGARKGSWNDDDDEEEGEAQEVQMARVTILETGEEIEVGRDRVEWDNERAFLPYQGRIVEVQTSFIQKEGHPDAPTEAYMRRLLRGEVDPEDEDV